MVFYKQMKWIFFEKPHRPHSRSRETEKEPFMLYSLLFMLMMMMMGLSHVVAVALLTGTIRRCVYI